ncbi:hypothetical protein [Cerasicoccus maritimus]|uniref:hypothetical protein n=1 Tax=Cerasicoccus maritimus TaxID=490089 RepID=UPI002852C423|nr:hypothetical protein [Cerasicoccus maritimus]
MIRTTILCLTWLIAWSGLSAQEAPPAINCKISLYLVGGKAKGAQAVAQGATRKAEKLYYFSAGEAHEVTVRSGQRTRAFQYTGPPDFKLYRLTGVGTDGLPTYSVAASISLKPGEQHTLLTLLEQGARYALLPVDLSRAAQERDTALMLNLGNLTIACLAGDQKFTLKPLESKQVPLRPVGSDLQFEIKCAAQLKDDWTIVYSGSQTVRKDSHYVFLLLPEDDGSVYRVIRFRV